MFVHRHWYHFFHVLGTQGNHSGGKVVLVALHPTEKSIAFSFRSLEVGGKYHKITQLAVHTTYIPGKYILPIGVIIWYRSHLLREPGFTPLTKLRNFQAKFRKIRYSDESNILRERPCGMFLLSLLERPQTGF